MRCNLALSRLASNHHIQIAPNHRLVLVSETCLAMPALTSPACKGRLERVSPHPAQLHLCVCTSAGAMASTNGGTCPEFCFVVTFPTSSTSLVSATRHIAVHHGRDNHAFFPSEIAQTCTSQRFKCRFAHKAINTARSHHIHMQQHDRHLSSPNAYAIIEH